MMVINFLITFHAFKNSLAEFNALKQSQLTAKSELSQYSLLTQHRVTYLPYTIHLGKNLMSKVILKSKVLHLRYQKVCQYGERYLKYQFVGMKSPLDPLRGSKN